VIDDDGAGGLDAIDEALAQAKALPAIVVAALFARSDRPRAETPPPPVAGERHLLLTGEGLTAAIVRLLNVRSTVDVIDSDWLVPEAGGAEPLAVADPLFAAALATLTHTARSPMSRERRMP
jgi:hypothetical protein